MSTEGADYGAFVSYQEAVAVIDTWRAAGDKIVFTNGCFDLLHIGHITYLRAARHLGTRLVVGINTDASVQRLKGSHRPIKDESTRLAIMASLEMVDAAILFDTDTPYALIQDVNPQVLVKGGDWPVAQIVGNDIVLSSGGEVRSLAFVEGHSTTAIEQRIIKAYLDT